MPVSTVGSPAGLSCSFSGTSSHPVGPMTLSRRHGLVVRRRAGAHSARSVLRAALARLTADGDIAAHHDGRIGARHPVKCSGRCRRSHPRSRDAAVVLSLIRSSAARYRWRPAVGCTAATGLGARSFLAHDRRTRPGFPLQYAPPKGFRSGAVRIHPHRQVPEQGITATLFYLADRGLLSPKSSPPTARNGWSTPSRKTGAWADVDPVSVAGRPGIDSPITARVSTRTAPSAGHQVQPGQGGHGHRRQGVAFDGGPMVTQGRTVAGWPTVSLALAICGFLSVVHLPDHVVGLAALRPFSRFPPPAWSPAWAAAQPRWASAVVGSRRVPPHACHRLRRVGSRTSPPAGPLHPPISRSGGRRRRGGLRPSTARPPVRCHRSGLVHH